MRLGPLAGVCLVAAVLGGVSVLLVGKATGWLDAHKSTTVVFRSSPAASGQATPVAVGPVGKPLAGNGFDPARIYARRAPGVVTIFADYGPRGVAGAEAQGSGFVVSRRGYILTNSHVITNAGEGRSGAVHAAARLYVEFQDRDRVPARIVGWDVYDDVGLIKVDPADHALTPVPLGDSARVAVGEAVAAIGSPFGNENSLGVGVVSATARSVSSLTSDYTLVDAIQTDAPINHGNSGGPLFDRRGRVIGIVAQIRSESGTAEGVAFAVPINSARRSMEQLIANGRVAYAYAGIETEDLIPSVARHFGYPVRQGAVITNVKNGSPAAAAGLRGGNQMEHALGVDFVRGGDVIVAIDGRPVRSSEDIVRIVSEDLSPGERAAFTIFRGQARVRRTVVLGERPANPA
jgi:S1-C subfamily serine protease